MELSTRRMTTPRVPRPYHPNVRMVRWPFSAFATIVMAVIPLFWPVLGAVLFAEVFCVAFYAVLVVVGNVLVYSAWIVAALFVLLVGRWV